MNLLKLAKLHLPSSSYDSMYALEGMIKSPTVDLASMQSRLWRSQLGGSVKGDLSGPDEDGFIHVGFLSHHIIALARYSGDQLSTSLTLRSGDPLHLHFAIQALFPARYASVLADSRNHPLVYQVQRGELRHYEMGSLDHLMLTKEKMTIH